MDEKQRIHGERYPVDEDFLAALAQMPHASGIALGFDRLVMLATGAQRIEQVIWTPVAETIMKARVMKQLFAPPRRFATTASRRAKTAPRSKRSRRAMPSRCRRRWPR